MGKNVGNKTSYLNLKKNNRINFILKIYSNIIENNYYFFIPFIYLVLYI